MNKTFFSILFTTFTFYLEIHGQSLPVYYQKYYEQDFRNSASVNDFVFSDPKAWTIKRTSGGNQLALIGKSNYQPAFRSPHSLAILSGFVWGDFVLQADVRQTTAEYGHRDVCFVWGMRDSAHFYYVHMASQTDEHAHGIFLVNGTDRVKIGQPGSSGVAWDALPWHRIRIERSIVKCLTRVYINDMRTPVFETSDPVFRMGYIGFGSFDDTMEIDNITIWAPTVIEQPAPFFQDR